MRPILLAGFVFLAIFFWAHRRRLLASTFLFLGLLFSLYYKSVRFWMDGLGSDSFLEAQNFEWHEAWFYIKSVAAVLQPLKFGALLETCAITLLIILFCCGLRRWVVSPSAGRVIRTIGRPLSGRRWMPYLGVLFVFIPVVSQAYRAYSRFESNSSVYEHIVDNFTHPDVAYQARSIGTHQMRVIVYIGESTSMMQWGLFGYPRDTSIELADFARQHAGLIAFDRVQSTHAHTSLSLLEALSFGMDAGEDYLPITERQRVSLVDVLDRLSIPTLLLSNQWATGASNMAGSVIFKNLSQFEYVRDNGLIGEQAWTQASFDGEYFKTAVQRFQKFAPQGPGVLFLHSYAGHGDYLANIPESARRPVDERFEGASRVSAFGALAGSDAPVRLKDQGYDSAMRYVSFSLADVMAQAANSDMPTAVVYFSDHGESPYGDFGHDSARFSHEMARVPFLMYFNDAARAASPDLYQRFLQAARDHRQSTLAQLPATVLRLLGYQMVSAAHAYAGVGLDPVDSLVPIIVRRLGQRITYIRSHGVRHESLKDADDVTDPATVMWLNRRLENQTAQAGAPALCYGGVNTWAKAARGSIVSDCLEVPLALNQDVLDAAPVVATGRPGWILDGVADIAARRQQTLRLGGSGLPAAQACAAVSKWISARPAQAGMAYELVLDATPGALPPACRQQAMRSVTMVFRVPRDIEQDDKRFGLWLASLASVTGSPRIVLSRMPSPEQLAALSRQNVDWDLDGVPAADLPWHTPALPGGLPAKGPKLLTMQTQWDLNSR